MMRRSPKDFLAVAFFLLIIPTSLRAASFTSAASGNWTTPATWSPNGVPAAGDDVIIQSPHNVAISDTRSVTNLTLSAGTLSGTGALTVTGAFIWSSGTLGTGGGSLTIASGATMSITTASNSHNLRTFTLNNQGTATWAAGAGEIVIDAGGLLNNSGTFDIQTDSGIRNFGGGTGTITNSGIWKKSAGIGTVVIGLQGVVNFNNSGGTIDVQTGLIQAADPATFSGTGSVTTGTFELAAGNTLSNGASYTGAGYLRLTTNAGLTIAAGSSSISNLELSSGNSGGSGISGTGALTISGNLRWNNGRIGGGGGSITISPGSTVDILTSSNLHILSAFTFNNQGVVTWASGAGEIEYDSGAVLNNSGIFDIQSDAGFRNFNGGNPAINNSGVWKKTAGAGTNTNGLQGTITFNNNGGTITVASGQLTMAGAFNPNGGSLTAGQMNATGGGASSGGFSLYCSGTTARATSE